MSQSAHRHPFYSGLRPRPECLQSDTAAGLQLGATTHLGDRSTQLRVVHVVQQQPRRAGGERLVDLLELRTSTSSAPASSAAAARTRATACAMPPAAAMWFSLMRIASYNPAL